MTKKDFDKAVSKLLKDHELLINRKNKKCAKGNNIYDRYVNPILTNEHTPVIWRYDLDYKTNPHLMQRIGMNAAFNSGAILVKGKYYMAVRVEGMNTANSNSAVVLDLFKVRFYPLEALPMISDSLVGMSVQGRIFKDPLITDTQAEGQLFKIRYV